jgi:hypothetical protein
VSGSVTSAITRNVPCYDSYSPISAAAWVI